MDRAGKYFFPGSAFAKQQHGRLAGRRLLGHIKRAFHLCAVTNDHAMPLIYFFDESLKFPLESLALEYFDGGTVRTISSW
jgi:hypothetical protein